MCFYRLISGIQNEIYEKAFKPAAIKRGRVYTPLSVAKYNASLMLGNSHVSLGQTLRFPQNYIPIAGYYINSEKIPPLPEVISHNINNLKKISFLVVQQSCQPYRFSIRKT